MKIYSPRLAASLRAEATDIALTRRCSKNCRHDFLHAEPDLRRRAFLYHDRAGHARADQDAGWHVRDVDPDRNALRSRTQVNVGLMEERSSVPIDMRETVPCSAGDPSVR